MSTPPKIVDFLVCDDVRQEVGGKRTIVGIYDKVLIVPTVPFNLPQLYFVIKLDFTKSDIAKMNFTVEMPGGQIIGPMNVGLSKEIQKQNPIMNLAVYPINIKETGMCQVFVTFDEQKKIKIGQIEIKLASSQPSSVAK
jgi:Family of unknown function (DUF6941)